MTAPDPTEVPPNQPGQPVEPPREEPPGEPATPDIPVPVREPAAPGSPEELPGRLPDELPVRGPAGRARPIP